MTKRFYDHFKRELTAFERFIDGITAQGDRDWYASLMLNRMMFVYFIQKQGFLDDNTDYLRTKLREVQDMPRQPASGHPEPASGHPEPAEGPGRFQQFYRIFLRRLFHEGLGQPEAQRAHELAELLGDVPFLNGGLFEVHNLERDNADISIPDEAFERVFNFFDNYSWHLDERPNHEDNEINPDVLGYIFEKYVNQKQMGAYYTKEDITGYISRNTVIPFLFDAAKRECRVAFEPDGGVWRLLRDDPDRYIYPAVGHGVTWNARNADKPASSPPPLPTGKVGVRVKRRGALLELPDEIAAGIDDVSKRGGWNAAAPEEYALPTETWREVVARRQRHAEVRAKLEAGEVREINDLITLNLDIERFARDVIAQSEGPELLRAFWHAIRDVSVLDPTCGSGAFLFAALNILEPLYTACLEGMQGFVDDAKRLRAEARPGVSQGLRDVLDKVDEHPNERYFILKSIVLNNLYGVDIMEEAVEICKLRLFLKLVAQLDDPARIEPLPDIDFNIRAGNTLVGFTSLDAVRDAMTMTPDGQHRALFDEERAALARIEEDAGGVAWKFDQFRWQQTIFGGEITPEHKAELHGQMESLSNELDRYLATEYGVDPEGTDAYDAWRASHKPFHWFAEFYGIMSKGGFDVVIGNPPYVEYKKVSDAYEIHGLQTLGCGNLYAFISERAIALLKQSGRFGFITPISLTAAQRMAVLQDYLVTNSSFLWLSNFALRPAALFPGVMQRNTICLSQKGKSGITYTTDYVTWYSKERPTLFFKLNYLAVGDLRQDYSIPKVNVCSGQTSLLKALSKTRPWTSHSQFKGEHAIYYHNAGGYWIKTFTFRPYYRSLTNPNKNHTTISELRMPSVPLATLYCALLNSSLFYFFWKSLTDARHIYPSDIAMFPIGLDATSHLIADLIPLVDDLMDELGRNSKRIVYGKAEVDQYNVAPCKFIIDENRPRAGGALRVHGRGARLHHQLRHQVPDGVKGLIT